MSIACSLAKAQNYEPQDSIVYDTTEMGGPSYVYNQMIVKFNPAIVDTTKINDTSFQIGTIADFIHPIALQMIVDSGYFDSSFANFDSKEDTSKIDNKYYNFYY